MREIPDERPELAMGRVALRMNWNRRSCLESVTRTKVLVRCIAPPG
jgi:hypothetical protein